MGCGSFAGDVVRAALWWWSACGGLAIWSLAMRMVGAAFVSYTDLLREGWSCPAGAVAAAPAPGEPRLAFHCVDFAADRGGPRMVHALKPPCDDETCVLVWRVGVAALALAAVGVIMAAYSLHQFIETIDCGGGARRFAAALRTCAFRVRWVAPAAPPKADDLRAPLLVPHWGGGGGDGVV